MAITKLKLGKGSYFVTSRLRHYPLEEAVWEVDFQPIPDEKHDEFWLGMVVDQAVGVEMALQVLEGPPTVNDLARILAEAIQRPIVEGSRHRPSTILLRDDSQWEELLPHLQELGIEVVKIFHEDHILAVHGSHREVIVLGMDAADLKTLAQWLGSLDQFSVDDKRNVSLKTIFAVTSSIPIGT